MYWGAWLKNLLLIGVCYQKVFEVPEVLLAIVSGTNGICKSTSSDSTFKTEINFSLKLRLSRTFNSTILRIRAIQNMGGGGGGGCLDLFG